MLKQTIKVGIILSLSLVGGLVALVGRPEPAHALTRKITFPIIGSASYSNDYYAPRSNGIHRATDIMAKKHARIVSPVNGTVTWVGYPEPSWGWMLVIEDNYGYEYTFIHINNDTPGTDDGKGGAMNAYAPDMEPGNKVVRGQHIAWVGDSGNAENTPPHLHFEMRKPDGELFNPYDSLQAARKISSPAEQPQMPNELLPHGNISKRGVSIAMGNFDGDPASELVTGGGVAAPPIVRVWDDSTNTRLASFYAYDDEFLGGIDIASGDVDGDGVDEIITAPGRGKEAVVKVFELDGTLIDSFTAYALPFKGGATVAAGNVDGDPAEEIITGTGKGGSPVVRTFELDGTQLVSFHAFAGNPKGGVDVSAGNVVGDATTELVIANGVGYSSDVNITQPNGTPIDTFRAFSSTFLGGVRVSVGNVRIDTALDEILVAPATGGSPQLRLFAFEGASINNGSMLTSDYFIERWWRGPYDVAAGYDLSRAATGANRRASVRLGLD